LEQQTLTAAPDAGTREAMGEAAKSAKSAAKTGGNSAKSGAPGGEEAFEKLITGAYKDIYQAKIQKIIDRRFKEARELETAHKNLTPVLRYLGEKTGRDTPDQMLLALLMAEERGAFDGFLREAAGEAAGQATGEASGQGTKPAGESGQGSADRTNRERETQTGGETAITDAAGQNPAVPTGGDGAAREAQMVNSASFDTLRQHSPRLTQAAKTYGGFMAEAAELQASDPAFNMAALRKNGRFLALLKAGFSMKEAYRAENQEAFLYEAMRFAAAETKKRLAASLTGKKSRPPEGALAARRAAVFKSSPGDMSKKEREEIAKRVMKGERIRF